MGFKIVKFKPCIVAFAGPPLAGKTTLGQKLSKQTNFKYFDIDDARWEIFPKTERLPDFREDLAMLASYTFNHCRAAESLIKGTPVAVGATYSREIYVELLRIFARSSNYHLRIFVLDTPEEVMEERIKIRAEEDNPSVVKSIEVVQEVRDRFKPIVGDEVVNINTGLTISECIDQILQILKPLRADSH